MSKWHICEKTGDLKWEPIIILFVSIAVMLLIHDKGIKIPLTKLTWLTTGWYTYIYLPRPHLAEASCSRQPSIYTAFGQSYILMIFKLRFNSLDSCINLRSCLFCCMSLCELILLLIMAIHLSPKHHGTSV